MRHLVPLGMALVLSVSGCSSSSPAYRPGSPGQWGGAGARAGYPWQPSPPPSPSAPPPRPVGQPQQPPNLIGTAVSAINVLLGSLPPPPQIPVPWPMPQPQQPSTDGTPASWIAFEDEVLARTNDKRAAGAVCGGQGMPPAPPVVASPLLRAAARGHSRDMAMRDYFSHTTPEGAGPGERAQVAGFRGSVVGENIAAGQVDPARVVEAWMQSPGHCENLMDPRYKVLGVGYFRGGATDRYEHYWTQNFGG